jgi:hypothetical protein
MNVTVYPYPEAEPSFTRYELSPGLTLEIDQLMEDDADDENVLPYPVEDAELQFNLQIWDEVTGTVLVDSEEDGIVPERYEGTDTTDDPSTLTFRLPDDLVAERLPVGAYRGAVWQRDALEGTRDRIHDFEIIIKSDIR